MAFASDNKMMKNVKHMYLALGVLEQLCARNLWSLSVWAQSLEILGWLHAFALKMQLSVDFVDNYVVPITHGHKYRYRQIRRFAQGNVLSLKGARCARNQAMCLKMKNMLSEMSEIFYNMLYVPKHINVVNFWITHSFLFETRTLICCTTHSLTLCARIPTLRWISCHTYPQGFGPVSEQWYLSNQEKLRFVPSIEKNIQSVYRWRYLKAFLAKNWWNLPSSPRPLPPLPLLMFIFGDNDECACVCSGPVGFDGWVTTGPSKAQIVTFRRIIACCVCHVGSSTRCSWVHLKRYIHRLDADAQDKLCFSLSTTIGTILFFSMYLILFQFTEFLLEDEGSAYVVSYVFSYLVSVVWQHGLNRWLVRWSTATPYWETLFQTYVVYGLTLILTMLMGVAVMHFYPISPHYLIVLTCLSSGTSNYYMLKTCFGEAVSVATVYDTSAWSSNHPWRDATFRVGTVWSQSHISTHLCAINCLISKPSAAIVCT